MPSVLNKTNLFNGSEALSDGSNLDNANEDNPLNLEINILSKKP